MAALEVKQVFKFIQFVANKEHKGWISPAEFNIAAEVAQLTLYSELESVYKVDKAAEADMRPFLKSIVLTAASTVIPVDFRIPVSAFIDTGEGDPYQYREVLELDVREVPAIMKSELVAPSNEYPRFYIDGANIIRLPATLEDIKLYYLKIPTAPEWAYTTDASNRPVYASGSSTDFEFDESKFMEISSRILQHVGINIGKEEITQYVMAKQQA